MMPPKKPQETWLVNGIDETPLRAPCLCGAQLASHMQRAPHPHPQARRRCSAFRPSHAGAVVAGVRLAS